MIGKSVRNPSALLVAPAILSCTLVGIDSVLVLWENLSNPLKARCRLARCHWNVEFNG